jgi:hypothetical protein
MRKRILFHSLIYVPSFSATQTRHRIRSRNTLCTSPKVRSFHTCAIAFSISPFEKEGTLRKECQQRREHSSTKCGPDEESQARSEGAL